MKSVFITFDQAFYERILALLDRQNCRGFSYWQQLQGCQPPPNPADG